MPRWRALLIGVVVLAIATVTFGPRVGTRGVTVVQDTPQESFGSQQSAALFVGVRQFGPGGPPEVPYAADDAVDLAFLFALDPRVSLIPPSQVVIALSGLPQKKVSLKRLAELKHAGARVENATADDIVTLLEQQAARAGNAGLLIVSLATHGFVHDGTPYILGSTSQFENSGTAIPAPRIFDMASAASSSLIFVDACRERIQARSGARGTLPSAKPPLLQKMVPVPHGQVVFYAAPTGGYAYDDPVARNGVFTKAILDGLRCHATATKGVVRVANLRTYVEKQVREWIHANVNPSAKLAIQVNIDGLAEKMPLAMCPPRPLPVKIKVHGSRVTVFDDGGKELWHSDVCAPIVHAEEEDLDADGRPEVVVATTTSLITFDRAGNCIWTAEEGMTLRTFIAGDLHRKATRQIVALWNDAQASTSRLVAYDAEGERLSAYDHEAELTKVAIYRPTNGHKPRIVAAGLTDVILCNAMNVRQWHRWAKNVVKLEFVDRDGDGKKDIALQTSTGKVYLTLEGKVLTAK